MHITHGVSVYPRFYYFNEGETIQESVYKVKDYSRLIFLGINHDEGVWPSYYEYLLPHKELIGNFPQDSVYRAISCKSDIGYEDVLAVTIDTPDGEQVTYMRDPLPEFSCPVHEPICISLENCY